MNTKSLSILAASACALFISACTPSSCPCNQKQGDTIKASKLTPATKLDAKTATTTKAYPLNTCLVMGTKLDPKKTIITKVYKGQEVKFCCKGCVIAFEHDPELYMSRVK